MPDEYYSYSRLQLFKQCPAHYRFRYIEKIPEPARSIESYLGICQHEALEWLYNERRKDSNILFDDLINRFNSQWTGNWDSNIMIMTAQWQASDYYQLGLRSLAGYFRRNYPFDEPVHGTEIDLMVCLDDDANYRLRSVIDRVDDHGSGRWSIHDYKTGKRMLSPAQARSDLQMRIYWLALIRNMPSVQRVDVAWHYLRHGRDLVIEDVGWNFRRSVNMLKKRIDHLQAADLHPAEMASNESILCNWCYHWDRCPAKQGQEHPARPA